MNPIVRHYLPSVIRGVYRFDEGFSDIEDQDAFEQFVDRKLRFLPCHMAKSIIGAAKIQRDYEKTKRDLILSEEAIDSRSEAHRRAEAFFSEHPYFREAMDGDVKDSDKYLEIQFVKRILAPLLNDKGMKVVVPQREVGPYRVDFTLEEGTTKFAIEVDGFGKFRERQDLDSFTRRQNYIANQGWRVIRYTYGQVINSTARTLREFHTLLKMDRQLWRYMAVQWHKRSLWESTTQPFEHNAIDLVNDFYRIQDHFVEVVLSGNREPHGMVIKDAFGLGFPFVASAISALFEFLQATEGIVRVDFQLPNVTVCGSATPPDWNIVSHPLVSVRQDELTDASVFDSMTVRSQCAMVPVPAREAGSVSFVDGLSHAEVHDRLDFFTRTIFDYPQGTKPFQNQILRRVFHGENVLGISATGSGKSFCFWMPALLRPGLSLVICPLRSLMRDQRLTLLNSGIASVEFINSDVDQLTQRRILEDVKLGYVRLLYIAPERLRIKKFLAELDRLQEFVPINLLAVDEAHCISEWGHDFRPSYLKLPFLRESLSRKNAGLQLIALTATAGQQVQQDMLGILKLRDVDVMREPLADRERFSYQVVVVKEGSTKSATYRDILTKDLPKALRQTSLSALLSLSNARGERAIGIVFCIYADPHGRSSIWDGTAHYLFETMHVLEPERIFESQRTRVRRLRLDAYSTGKVRAFSSKPPTLCPKDNSYAYTSKSRNDNYDDGDDEESGIVDREDTKRTQNNGGIKVCPNGHEFDASKAISPPGWDALIKKNQEEFKKSGFDILVATKGFGMGIDKSSVRFVIHTSFPSGLESWYQEVGRAGRDEERAHIVLLVDPPNERCRAELDGSEIKRPNCSYRSGCTFGKEGLCDYGKQHMFISASYPGAESDAIGALRMLDKVILAGEHAEDGMILVNSSNKYLSRDELAIYRLAVLGLVRDYVITYRPHPRFDIHLAGVGLPNDHDGVRRLEERMQERLAEHLSHFVSRRGRTILQELRRCREDYSSLDTFSAKLRNFEVYSQYMEIFDQPKLAFYRSVYEHLLLLLDHTYNDVVKMRYDMLWNLLGVVTTGDCRRLHFLGHFGETWPRNHRCDCCDNCRKKLDFADRRNPPPINPSVLERDLQLQELFVQDRLDLDALRQLCEGYADYSVAKYRQARAVLEGNANNLPALFVAREFSPPEELEGNSKRLLRTANQRPVSFAQVKDIFNTSSPAIKAEMLELLNEADTACDSREGWSFLTEEASRSEYHANESLSMIRACLEFFLVVTEESSEQTKSLKARAGELEEAFYA